MMNCARCLIDKTSNISLFNYNLHNFCLDGNVNSKYMFKDFYFTCSKKKIKTKYPWVKCYPLICDECVAELIVNKEVKWDGKRRYGIPYPLYSSCCDELITSKNELFGFVEEWKNFPYVSSFTIFSNDHIALGYLYEGTDERFKNKDIICRKCSDNLSFCLVYDDDEWLDYAHWSRDENLGVSIGNIDLMSAIQKDRQRIYKYSNAIQYQRDDAWYNLEEDELSQAINNSRLFHQEIADELTIYIITRNLKLLRHHFHISKDIFNHLLGFIKITVTKWTISFFREDDTVFSSRKNNISFNTTYKNDQTLRGICDKIKQLSSLERASIHFIKEKIRLNKYTNN